MLIVVWVGALAGVVLKTAWPHAPAWVGVPIYIALGWVAVFVLPDMLVGGGVAALVLLLVGGLLYTVGAVFYATRWPNPWPAHVRLPRVLPRRHGARGHLPPHRDLARPVLTAGMRTVTPRLVRP